MPFITSDRPSLGLVWCHRDTRQIRSLVWLSRTTRPCSSIGPTRCWTETLEGRAFGSSELAGFGTAGTGPLLETTVPTGTPGALVVASDGATTIRLLLPDGVAPDVIGTSADPRVLGF